MAPAVARALVLVGICLTFATPVAATPAPVSDSTWVDHDARPVPKPPDSKENDYGRFFHEIFVEPISHALDIPDKAIAVASALGSREARRTREASNVNAFDEVPNSSWFTNRN